MRLYAFWRYSSFPYVLGGEVLKMLEDGRVTVHGYDGMVFMPLKIVPFESGQKLKAELDLLERRRSRELRELEAAFLQKARTLLPEVDG